MADEITNVWETERTLTGLTLAEVRKEVDRDLGPNAYAPIPGTNLTDIKPAFVTELLNDVFGPPGIGWGAEVLEKAYVGSTDKRSAKGREYTEHYATATVRNWFAVRNPEDPKNPIRVPIDESSGGSSNEVAHYAMQGAKTNAGGNGWKQFGVQAHIYKNEAAPRRITAKPEAAEPRPGAYSWEWLRDVIGGQRTPQERDRLADLVKGKLDIAKSHKLRTDVGEAKWDALPSEIKQQIAAELLGMTEVTS